MRNLITRLGLGIYVILKGDALMMAMLFACRIVEERTKFEQVPRLPKQDVADILINSFGMPEIVPTEYGGTLEVNA